uniref:t-SNARE coiled-coil homology domain-containing protein n=1 Tax=Heterorhabditis bacteriophora TaxID=37862 RepID=A0A1I7WMV9_HETBA
MSLLGVSTTTLADFEQQYSLQTAEVCFLYFNTYAFIHNMCCVVVHIFIRIYNVKKILIYFSAERMKYELRVRSYQSDKKQLDSELDKAVRRLREGADREELLALDEAVEMNQQIGTEVLGNLSSQRETITRARERMREADVELSRSSRLLNTMIRRVIQNRLLLLAVAVLLMFSLLFLVYKSL